MIFSPPHLLDSRSWRGLRVGLLGGSFNPPHKAHIHISLIALQMLRLDAIWWLVSPQNPLKPDYAADIDTRIGQCQKLVRHPAILISDIERHIGYNRTYDTVRTLKRFYSQTEMIWITGMDNALTFHKWHRWRGILNEIATAHIARPPASALIEACPLKMLGTQNHTHLTQAGKVRLTPHETYWILQKHMLDISSTKIRNLLYNS